MNGSKVREPTENVHEAAAWGWGAEGPRNGLEQRGPQSFQHQGPISWKTIFQWTGKWGGGNSNALHLLHTLFLLLLHQLHLRSSGIRIPEAGDPCFRALVFSNCNVPPITL